jgi:hypothetical protein
MANRSAEEWRSLLDAQARSGKTAAAFCRDHGVCPKYFYSRKKLFGQVAEVVERASPFVRVEPVLAPGPVVSEPMVRLRLGRCEWELSGIPIAEVASLMKALA